MSKISLTGLRAQGIHGVLDHEKVEPQEFVVDVEMWLDTTQAEETDDIAETVSYAEVADAIVEIIEGEHANLIETLLSRIIARLREFPVRGGTVTVHKPNAPIPHQFEDVSVQDEWWNDTDDEAIDVVISLGSNLDHPHMHVRKAVEEIGCTNEVLAVSSMYETEPQLDEGQAAQPHYMNAVMKIRTYKGLEELLDDLQLIENKHGRMRDVRWEARTLDLDIIKAGDDVYNTARLTVPHPRAHLRRFVLEPWLEIEPEATLGGRLVADIVSELPIQGVRRVDAFSLDIAKPTHEEPADRVPESQLPDEL